MDYSKLSTDREGYRFTVAAWILGAVVVVVYLTVYLTAAPSAEACRAEWRAGCDEAAEAAYHADAEAYQSTQGE